MVRQVVFHLLEDLTDQTQFLALLPLLVVEGLARRLLGEITHGTLVQMEAPAGECVGQTM